jgi:hypothetical protein
MPLCLFGVCIPLNLVVPFLLGVLHRLGLVDPVLEWAARLRKKSNNKKEDREVAMASSAAPSAPTARRRQPPPRG